MQYLARDRGVPEVPREIVEHILDAAYQRGFMVRHGSGRVARAGGRS